MRTGDARGFTYLGVLFFVAISSAALAALGQHWSTAAQRERERELEFRGGEIARAIDSYLKAGNAQPPAYPRSLEDLLRDGRGIKPRYHLRRLYSDPFTGQADWVLIPAPSDPRGFHGVHSSSELNLLRRINGESAAEARALDWNFLAQADLARPDPGARPVDPAASAAGR